MLQIHGNTAQVVPAPLDHHYWGIPTSHDGSERRRPLPLVLEDGSQKDKKESGAGEKKKDPTIHVSRLAARLGCVTSCVSWFRNCLGATNPMEEKKAPKITTKTVVLADGTYGLSPQGLHQIS